MHGTVGWCAWQRDAGLHYAVWVAGDITDYQQLVNNDLLYADYTLLISNITRLMNALLEVLKDNRLITT